jgi:hypothetical protein
MNYYCDYLQLMTAGEMVRRREQGAGNLDNF